MCAGVVPAQSSHEPPAHSGGGRGNPLRSPLPPGVTPVIALQGRGRVGNKTLAQVQQEDADKIGLGGVLWRAPLSGAVDFASMLDLAAISLVAAPADYLNLDHEFVDRLYREHDATFGETKKVLEVNAQNSTAAANLLYSVVKPMTQVWTTGGVGFIASSFANTAEKHVQQNKSATQANVLAGEEALINLAGMYLPARFSGGLFRRTALAVAANVELGTFGEQAQKLTLDHMGYHREADALHPFTADELWSKALVALAMQGVHESAPYVKAQTQAAVSAARAKVAQAVNAARARGPGRGAADGASGDAAEGGAGTNDPLAMRDPLPADVADVEGAADADGRTPVGDQVADTSAAAGFHDVAEEAPPSPELRDGEMAVVRGTGDAPALAVPPVEVAGARGDAGAEGGMEAAASAEATLPADGRALATDVAARTVEAVAARNTSAAGDTGAMAGMGAEAAPHVVGPEAPAPAAPVAEVAAADGVGPARDSATLAGGGDAAGLARGDAQSSADAPAGQVAADVTGSGKVADETLAAALASQFAVPRTPATHRAATMLNMSLHLQESAPVEPASMAELQAHLERHRAAQHALLSDAPQALPSPTPAALGAVHEALQAETKAAVQGRAAQRYDKYDPVRIANHGFRKHLEQLIGPPPKGMYKPHAHHILFKRGLKTAQQALVKEGQALLREYGIDPIYGRENLVWAPNGVVGQHDIKALRHVVDELKAVKAGGGDREDIVAKLKMLGEIAANRR